MADIKDTSAQLQAIGNLIQSLGIGNNAGDWNKNALVALWNKANAGDLYARQIFESTFGPARDNALSVSDSLRGNVNAGGSVLDSAQAQQAGIPDVLRQFLSGDYSPLNAGQTSAAGRAGNTADIASQLFAGGGWTPQSEQLYSLLAPLMAGQGNNTQLALGDVAPNLISQRGQTAYTQNIQDRAGDAANFGGRNNDLNFAIDQAKETLAGNGYTPQGQAQQAQGMDAFTAAMNKALGGQLLSPGDAANWGREEATNDILGQSQAIYRQAAARGGTPGSLTASGTGNQMLADFADQAAQLQSDAARKAFLGQEDKVLQDKSIAGSVAGVGANLANSAEQNATARTGQAFSAIPGTQNAATSFMNSLLGAGGDAGNQEVSRMNAGTGMAQTLLGSQTAAAGQFNNALGNQNQYALGGGQLAQQGSANQANILNNVNQTGLQGAGTQIQGQNQAQGNTNNAWGNIAQAYQSAVNPLTQMSGQALNYAGNNVSLMGAPFQRIDAGSTAPGQGTNWGNVLAGALGVANRVGGLFGGGASGSGEGPQGGNLPGGGNGDYGGETGYPSGGGGGGSNMENAMGYLNLFGTPGTSGFGSYGTPGFAGWDPNFEANSSMTGWNPFWNQWN